MEADKAGAGVWERRGRALLIVAFVCLGLTYLAERIVYHLVAGPGSLGTSLGIAAVLAGLGLLVSRGQGWPRWLIGAFFVLNGLGAPAGLPALVGPALATLIALGLLAAHLMSAGLLCLAPGIPAYLRAVRAARAARA